MSTINNNVNLKNDTDFSNSNVFVQNEHNYCYDNNTSTNCKTSSNNEDNLNPEEHNLEKWQKVQYGSKRSIENEGPNQNHESQKKYRVVNSSNVSRPVIPVKNTYDVLSDQIEIDEMQTDKIENTPKPPPVFVPEVIDVNKMVTVVESVLSKNEYFYKCLAQNKVRINPQTPEAYRKLVKKLSDIKVGFHTYQLKQERAFRVALKNMHFSTDTDDLKSAIESFGHQVRNISNAKHFKTKEPLSLFFVDLEPAKNNKDIYNIEFLLNARVIFESPLRKPEVVQCKKCQRYGHTKSYCWYQSRCVKCGLSHDTSSCTKTKSDGQPPKCVLCNGDHPANYKGCSIYQNIKSKSFPPLREKIPPNNSSNMPIVSPPPIVEEIILPPRPKPQPTSKYTYAQATNPSVSSADNLNLSQTLNTFFEKFEKLMTQQAQQIGTLINLLTTVISKLK